MRVERLLYRVHALRRMFERRIPLAAVRGVIEFGRTIEEYPEDHPYPSRLILGWTGERPLHVVAAEAQSGVWVVITVYEPDLGRWEPGFVQRRSE